MDVFQGFLTYVVPYINFLIFLAIVAFFAKKPLANLALTRKKEFQKHLDEASQTLKTAQEQLEDLRKRHQSLDKEIAGIRERVETEAKAEAAAIIDEGKKQAEYLMAEARRIRDVEYLQAQKKLEAEAIESVKQKLITKFRKDFDQNADERFIQARLKEIQTLVKENKTNKEAAHV